MYVTRGIAHQPHANATFSPVDPYPHQPRQTYRHTHTSQREKLRILLSICAGIFIRRSLPLSLSFSIFAAHAELFFVCRVAALYTPSFKGARVRERERERAREREKEILA